MLNTHPLKVHGYTDVFTSRAHFMIKCDDFDILVRAINTNKKFVELTGLAGEDIIISVDEINSARRVTPIVMNLINTTNAICNERDDDSSTEKEDSDSDGNQ